MLLRNVLHYQTLTCIQVQNPFLSDQGNAQADRQYSRIKTSFSTINENIKIQCEIYTI